MRKMLFPLVLLAACSPDATAPTAPIDPFLDPTLAVDYTMPAPTDVSAAVVQVLDRRRSSVRVTWTDNSTYVDEFNTCAAAFAQDGTAAGGGCIYAEDYDQPRGSTGVRSGTISVGSNAVSVSVRVFRRYQLPEGGWYNVGSPWTERVAITPLPGVSPKGKGKP